MRIYQKDINKVKPYNKNPRKNDDSIQLVANSIRQFGMNVPIVIDKNNVIVAGHTRFEACKELGYSKIPCITVSELTDEQVKAYRLADNKVSEFSSWDFGLLDEELNDILDIDMTDFGFEEIADGITEDYADREKASHRENTYKGYNLDLYDPDNVDGKYQMPMIYNDGIIPDRLIGFNYMKTSKDKETGIHCYVDDYQFERVWNSPSKYIEEISKYECILSPDFSLYLDMPFAMKIWNVYRSRLIGQYWQNNGTAVIPTISWAEEETFEFCFDGIEKGSIVSISTIGVKRNKEGFEIWEKGVKEMIKRIEPSAILIYGGKVDFDFGDIEVRHYKNEVTERMNNYQEGEDE